MYRMYYVCLLYLRIFVTYNNYTNTNSTDEIRKAITDPVQDKYFLLSTLSGQKYLYTTKYQCTDCAIYRLKNQLGTKMGIEICRDQNIIVLALTLVKIFDF